MLKKLKIIWQLAKYMGVNWVVFRIKYAVQIKMGILETRTPLYDLNQLHLKDWLNDGIPFDPLNYREWRRQNAGSFFFQSLPETDVGEFAWNRQAVVEEANKIIAGKWKYFDHASIPVGCPPNWHVNPITNDKFPHDKHWSRIKEFGQGDIKLVWEASRFSVVYTLVRAYAVTKDEKYPQFFWNLVEDWANKNPPNLGVNWKCGQEASIRVMAWCFGLYSFENSIHTTPERTVLMSKLMVAHGQRIAGNIDYAYSTKSNHGISEAVGLWTISVLFPEFTRSNEWQKTAQTMLENEISRQIYDDGSYSMHSVNYYRMSLQACFWVLRLGELNNAKLSPRTYSILAKGVDFLLQLLDLDTGRVPNYGSNDGALILPINTCDYTDFRPLLQLGYYCTYHERLFESGSWDEDLFWLYGMDALKASHIIHDGNKIDDLTAEQGGIYTLRSESSWSMIHCGQYYDRPSHMDQLHVELWWKGINIACDAGTYSYNEPDPWQNGLASTSVHNTVQIDNQEQMTKAGHFTWVNWLHGEVRFQTRSANNSLAYWEGQYTIDKALDRPVKHRRGVARIDSEHWVVIDNLGSESTHNYRLHWLMPLFPHSWDESNSLDLETSQGNYLVNIDCDNCDAEYSLEEGNDNSVQGWQSLYYRDKQPALSFTAVVTCESTTFISIFGPNYKFARENGELVITMSDRIAHIKSDAKNNSQRLIESILLTDINNDLISELV